MSGNNYELSKKPKSKSSSVAFGLTIPQSFIPTLGLTMSGFSLPAVAASTVAAMPIVGIADEIYRQSKGLPPRSITISPKERSNITAIPSTTRVQNKAVPISVRSTEYVNSGPYMLAVRNKEKNKKKNSNTQAGNTQAGNVSPNPNEKKSLRQKITDKVNEIIKGKQKTTETKPQTTPQNSVTDESSWTKNIGRFLWETKGNNYGDLYKWRNLGRIVLSPITVPLATEGVGYSLGFLSEKVPNLVEGMGEAFERGKQKASGTSQRQNTDNIINQSQERRNTLETDSTNADGTYRVVPRTVPVYTQQQRDSVERLNRQMFQELR